MQKVRCHFLLKLQLLIGLLVQVLFHQSSTYFSPFTHVTLHYRQICYTQPWRMVPPYSYKADVLILLINTSLSSHTGLSPSMGLRKLYFLKCLLIPKYYACQTKFWLFWFHSPLLPESLLISFPIGTIMFYFPTFYTIRFTLGLYKYSDLQYLYFQYSTSFSIYLLGIPNNPFNYLTVHSTLSSIPILIINIHFLIYTLRKYNHLY